MLNRRWPSPTTPSMKMPSSSGPRWVITSRMRLSTAVSTVRRDLLENAMPFMPHIEIFDYGLPCPLSKFEWDRLSAQCRLKIGDRQLAIESTFVSVNLELTVGATRGDVLELFSCLQNMATLE